MIELHVKLSTPKGKREFFVLVPEMRPVTFDAVMDKAGWEFDPNSGAWKLRRGNFSAEVRLVHTLEHDDHFDAILTGPKSWRLVEALLAALGGGAE